MKKPNHKQRRLVLNKERVRQLEATLLVDVKGGARDVTTHDELCDPTVC